MDRDQIVDAMARAFIDRTGIPANTRVMRRGMEAAFDVAKAALAEWAKPTPGVTNPLDDEAMWGSQNV